LIQNKYFYDSCFALNKLKLNKNFGNENKVICLTLATKLVDPTKQSQSNTKTPDNTNFQSNKCLSEATGNPTSQVPPCNSASTSRNIHSRPHANTHTVTI